MNKDKLKDLGMVALKVGKQIVIEGTIAVTAKGAAQVLRVGLEDGFDSVKTISVDQFLGTEEKEAKKEAKKIAKNKKKIKKEVKKNDIVERRMQEKAEVEK